MAKPEPENPFSTLTDSVAYELPETDDRVEETGTELVYTGLTLPEVPLRTTPAKRSVTFYISDDTAERLRDMCHYERQSISKVVDHVLSQFVDALEKQRGHGYPRRRGPLQRGPQ